MAARGPVLARVGLAGRRSGLEPWFAPFALINGAAVGLVPILLPIVAVRYGVSHVGLVMGAFNLGAIAAPAVGGLADRYRAYPSLVTVCAASGLAGLVGSVVGGLAADLWGYPAALGLGARGVLVGLAIFAVKVLPGGGRP